MKSKVALKRALIKLLTRQSLMQISVKKLCQEAEVGRSTFYSHYNNLDELLEELENDLVKELSVRDSELADRKKTKPSDFSYFLDVVDYIKEHKTEILVLTKFRPDARFIEKWKNAIKANLHKRGLPKDDLLYEMVAAETIAAFDYYLLSPEKYSESQIQKVVVQALKIFEK
ncbi:hypothetical protein [Lactobacillus sp. LL6]|uniref:hypothetical protein n=1 Tax=Lactobacillus sp. LL6 TaxID=2596827 RepID=UPI0011866E58|nr:hypothetical protein [Lactobacillus sp. LL6]TSO26612.1 hypothetical protein FOD82_05975 [Lactobacillus sp. LL6]